MLAQLGRVSIVLSWPQETPGLEVKTTEIEELGSPPTLGLWTYTNAAAIHTLSNTGQSAMQTQEAVIALTTIPPCLASTPTRQVQDDITAGLSTLSSALARLPTEVPKPPWSDP